MDELLDDGLTERPTRANHDFLVLCSECAVHDPVDDGVDGTTQEPQASGEDEDLKRKDSNSFK